MGAVTESMRLNLLVDPLMLFWMESHSSRTSKSGYSCLSYHSRHGLSGWEKSNMPATTDSLRKRSFRRISLIRCEDRRARC